MLTGLGSSGPSSASNERPSPPGPTPRDRLRSTWASERPRATDFDRLGRPSDSARPTSTRFSTIPGRFCDRFSSFFDVAPRERLDSQREGPNLCFCWHAQYFGGFADFAKKPKIDKNRRKIASTMRCKQVARPKLDFFAPGRDLASILVASARSWTLPGASLGVPGCPC